MDEPAAALAIASELADHPDRQPMPADPTEATFTLMDSGQYDLATITPLISPPQAAAMAAGAVHETAAIHDRVVVTGHTVARLAGDHPIVPRAHASSFTHASSLTHASSFREDPRRIWRRESHDRC